jgi:hypothetical protein
LTLKRDVSRAKAQEVITELFGERGFARKPTKTKPGMRKQVALRSSVPPFKARVIGSGRTWLMAIRNAAENLNIPDLVATADELITQYQTKGSYK